MTKILNNMKYHYIKQQKWEERQTRFKKTQIIKGKEKSKRKREKGRKKKKQNEKYMGKRK